jgi:hypothetical protein
VKLISQGIIPQHLTTKSSKRVCDSFPPPPPRLTPHQRPSRKKRLSSGSIQSSLLSDLNVSTISYGSGSSARSGSSGMSRSTTPPLGIQGYSPSPFYSSHTITTPLRPTFYSTSERVNHFPLSRPNESADRSVTIAPGLSYEYDQGHGKETNFEQRYPYHDGAYLDEDLPVYTPPTNSHPRRRRTVPGFSVSMDVGTSGVPVAPGIDSVYNHGHLYQPNSSSHSQYPLPHQAPQVSSQLNQKATAYIPNAFRNR